MDNVEIKKSNLEAAYKQADDNTKKLLATLFGDAVTTKDDRPVTEPRCWRFLPLRFPQQSRDRILLYVWTYFSLHHS